METITLADLNKKFTENPEAETVLFNTDIKKLVVVSKPLSYRENLIKFRIYFNDVPVSKDINGWDFDEAIETYNKCDKL